MKKIIILLSLLFVANISSGQSIIDPENAPRLKEVRSAEGFVHPGIILSAEDMNFVRRMVREGREPWAEAFDRFRSRPKALKSYKVLNRDRNGQPKFPVMAEGYGQYDARRDADAAFAQSIMWYITGDNDYRDKVLDILRMWYRSVKMPSTDLLTAGMAMQKFCFAAEIMRYATGSGWTAEDTEGFKRFLQVMLPSNDKPTAYMNQGSIANMGYMASGVFMDDMEIYRKAVDRTAVGSECEKPITDYSIRRQIKEVVDSLTGRKGVILVEMGRDQAHAQGDIGALGCLARTTLIQGTKINPRGEMVDDSTGVNLFEFLDNRLLRGAATAARYTFGYDVFYPALFGGEFAGEEFAEALNPECRGQMAAVFELIYNYYLDCSTVACDDADLLMLKRIVDFKGIEEDSEDFPGDGTLLFAREPRALNVAPKGEPVALQQPDYQELTKSYGRIAAETFWGSIGKIKYTHTNFGNGDVGYRPIIDREGARRIVSEVKDDFCVWYKEIDFGKEPVDRIIMRTGSSLGCKVDLVLLDNVEGLDADNVTREDIARGEKIATVQVPVTGWWTYFTDFSAELDKKVSGKHILAMRFYGSGHVYTLQLTLDWFKFAARYSFDNNLMTEAKRVSGKTVFLDDGATMSDGCVLGFDDIDFDSGAEWLCSRIATTSEGILELRVGKPDGELIASYRLPSTGGELLTVQRPNDIESEFRGVADICFVYRGSRPALINSYSNKRTMLQYDYVSAPRTATSVAQGEALLGTDRDYVTVKALPEGTIINLSQINFMNGPTNMALRIRTDKECRMSLRQASFVGSTQRDRSEKTDDFITIDLPDTHGEWQTLFVDMCSARRKVTGACMVVATFKGDSATVDFDGIQFDALQETKL